MRLMIWILTFLPLVQGSWDIRLVNGSHNCSGRLEVYNEDQWGTMCYVIIEIAQLVCRDLGCGYAASATQASLFGEGAGPIWKPIIECVSVISYEHCMITTMQTTSCNHSEDAGVICSDILNIRLANGANNCSGRVEFYYKDQWEAGCVDYWDMRHAQVVCRELGCGYAVSASVGARSGNRTSPYWRKGYHCSGEEQSLISCSVKELTTCHKEASVICSDDLLDFISSSTFSSVRCVFIICYLLVMSTAVITERVIIIIVCTGQVCYCSVRATCVTCAPSRVQCKKSNYILRPLQTRRFSGMLPRTRRFSGMLLQDQAFQWDAPQDQVFQWDAPQDQVFQWDAPSGPGVSVRCSLRTRHFSGMLPQDQAFQ
ncbi:UNVERIFIED_CONTAM: hypothetical protein FKN15_064506 [Acipenser sinensis]